MRHDEAAQILGVIRIVVAARDLAGNAVFPYALIIHLVAEIETEESVAEIIDADFRFANAFLLGALADHLNDATGIGAAVEHRRRPLQDFNPLQTIGIHLETAETVTEQVQPIQKHPSLGGLKTANVKPVRIRIRAKGLRRHARGIPQHLVDLRHRAAIVHFLAADDRYGLRNISGFRLGF